MIDSQERFNTLWKIGKVLESTWGNGWKAEPARYDHMRLREIHMVKDTPEGDKQDIDLIIWDNDDMVTVVARCHGTHGRFNIHLYSSDKPDRLTIKVGLARDPERIAKDIQRRLLPAYEELWEISKQRKQSDEEYKSRVHGLAAEISAACGGEPCQEGNNTKVIEFAVKGGTRAKFEVRAGEVDVTLKYASPTLALLIANLLKGQKP